MKRTFGDGMGRLRGRGAVLAGAGVALFLLSLFLNTLAPTVLYYDKPATPDSAMLQAEAAVLGVGHPTGYPTYMMLTHLFTYLPLGDVAYRANLASAVYGVAAVVVIYLIALRLSGRAVAAAAGALAFGTSREFWSQAVIAEVYTLNALFLALAVFVLLVWRDRRRDRYLLLAAFLVGLSLTHHLTSGLLVPAGLAFVLLTERRKLLEAGLVLKGAGLFLVGLLPDLYLPVRAAMDAPMNAPDPSTPGRFLALITGGSYLLEPPEGRVGCAGSALASVDFPDRLQLFGGHALGQFPLALALLGAFAAFYLLRADRATAALLGVIFLGSVAHAFAYLQSGFEDFYVFLIPAYLVFGLCISVGLGVVSRSAEGVATRRPPLGRFLVVALSALALALPLPGAWEAYAANDRSRDYEGRKTVEAVARSAEPGATVLHHRSPLWYMVLVEERRRDLTLIDPFCTPSILHNDLVWPDPLNATQSAARHRTDDTTGVGAALEAAKEGPVYILGREFEESVADADRFRKAGFDVVRLEDGLLYELIPRGRVSPEPAQ